MQGIFLSSRSFFLIALFSVFLKAASAQSPDYRQVFGKDWEKAMAYESENREWMSRALEKWNISYPLAISIIFPELVRYSALRDKMEITLLKALYVNLGEEYADFSIGVFQMKPSFAETVREKMPHQRGLFVKRSDFNDIREYRKSIVQDLETPESQLNYLIAFIKIVGKQFKNEASSEKLKVKYFSALYNYGIERQVKDLQLLSDKKYFNTKLIKTENYSYSDISLFWYNEYMTSHLTRCSPCR